MNDKLTERVEALESQQRETTKLLFNLVAIMEDLFGNCAAREELNEIMLDLKRKVEEEEE